MAELVDRQRAVEVLQSVLPEVKDIAAAIVFLAGPAARCITGVTLPVDSGYLAR